MTKIRFRKNSAYQTRNLPVNSYHSLRSAHDFFSNKVIIIKYWNQLPLGVRCSANINAFKAGLDRFKSSKPDSNGFWEQSEQILDRINADYLLADRGVAMRHNILFYIFFLLYMYCTHIP